MSSTLKVGPSNNEAAILGDNYHWALKTMGYAIHECVSGWNQLTMITVQ